MIQTHTHYDLERLTDLALHVKLGKYGNRTFELTLNAGDTAWHPGTDDAVIHGPAEVRYTRIEFGNDHPVSWMASVFLSEEDRFEDDHDDWSAQRLSKP